MNVVLSLVLGD